MRGLRCWNLARFGLIFNVVAALVYLYNVPDHAHYLVGVSLHGAVAVLNGTMFWAMLRLRRVR